MMYAEHRLVCWCPAANRDIGNAMADSDDFGNLGPVFSVPLSADGGASVTHYGCHAWVDGLFLEMLQARADLLAAYDCRPEVDVPWPVFLSTHGLTVFKSDSEGVPE